MSARRRPRVLAAEVDVDAGVRPLVRHGIRSAETIEGVGSRATIEQVIRRIAPQCVGARARNRALDYGPECNTYVVDQSGGTTESAVDEIDPGRLGEARKVERVVGPGTE